MPIFEFSCDKCGNKEEKIISYEESEKIKPKCKCGKGILTKIKINNFNFALKGNWFRNNGKY